LPPSHPSAQSIPVTILSGSDRKAGQLPESGAGLHALAAYKGVAVTMEGRPLIEILVTRLNATEGFGPVTIAGPERVYGPLGLPADIVDTDGSVAANLRAAIDRHLAVHGEKPMGLLACDVVPTVEDLTELRNDYERDRPCAGWFPLVRKPVDEETLGIFAWKPSYSMQVDEGEEPIRILPGHLGIIQPSAFRLPLIYHLLDVSYKTRNSPVATRRWVMLRHILSGLIWQDIKLLTVGRFPTLTATIVTNGLRLATRLRAGRLEVHELERLIGEMLLRHDYQIEHQREGIRHPIIDLLSMAQDVDTEEEAREIASRRRSKRRTKASS